MTHWGADKKEQTNPKEFCGLLLHSLYLFLLQWQWCWLWGHVHKTCFRKQTMNVMICIWNILKRKLGKTLHPPCCRVQRWGFGRWSDKGFVLLIPLIYKWTHSLVGRGRSFLFKGDFSALPGSLQLSSFICHYRPRNNEKPRDLGGGKVFESNEPKQLSPYFSFLL